MKREPPSQVGIRSLHPMLLSRSACPHWPIHCIYCFSEYQGQAGPFLRPLWEVKLISVWKATYPYIPSTWVSRGKPRKIFIDNCLCLCTVTAVGIYMFIYVPIYTGESFVTRCQLSAKPALVPTPAEPALGLEVALFSASSRIPDEFCKCPLQC